jgi:hypothetical protein
VLAKEPSVSSLDAEDHNPSNNVSTSSAIVFLILIYPSFMRLQLAAGQADPFMGINAWHLTLLFPLLWLPSVTSKDRIHDFVGDLTCLPRDTSSRSWRRDNWGIGGVVRQKGASVMVYYKVYVLVLCVLYGAE